jgi:hypothetical protein
MPAVLKHYQLPLNHGLGQLHWSWHMNAALDGTPGTDGAGHALQLRRNDDALAGQAHEWRYPGVAIATIPTCRLLGISAASREFPAANKGDAIV